MEGLRTYGDGFVTELFRSMRRHGISYQNERLQKIVGDLLDGASYADLRGDSGKQRVGTKGETVVHDRKAVENSLVLYVQRGDPTGSQAEEVLLRAGFNVVVKQAPLHYQSAYSVPVLFSWFGISEGLPGVQRFADNVSGVQR